MPYVIADLVARSGAAPRTIRGYIERGLVPKPRGNGPAAVYSEEAMLRVVAITRLRAKGESLAAIAKRLERWTRKQLASFVAETEPTTAGSAPAPEVPAEHALHAAQGEPAASLPEHGADASAAIDAATPDALATVPEALHYSLVPLMPGLALMVTDDAAPVVRRIANEVIARYSAGRRDGRARE
jgi:DNA-binding transcriptional MerR regulator